MVRKGNFTPNLKGRWRARHNSNVWPPPSGVALYPAELRAHLTFSLVPPTSAGSTDSAFTIQSHITVAGRLRPAIRCSAPVLRKLLTRRLRENFSEFGSVRRTTQATVFTNLSSVTHNETPLTSAFGGQRSIQLSYGRFRRLGRPSPLLADLEGKRNPLDERSLEEIRAHDARRRSRQGRRRRRIPAPAFASGRGSPPA